MNGLFSLFSASARTLIDHLPKPAQHALAQQLAALDRSTLQQQQALLERPPETFKEVKPFEAFSRNGNLSHQKLGKEALARGEVGCLILAGGDGSRLGYAGPKGTFPISCVKHKSLFQLFAEKTKAASTQAQSALPLAIMTSPSNHETTLRFFAEHSDFGLSTEQLSFFTQGTLPFLDTEGHLFLSAPDKIAQGPDGNGGALQAFYRSGLWGEWTRKGIKYLNLILVDNPLADPFDAELVGCCQAEHADVVIKSTFRIDEQERVGVIALDNGMPVVIEYTEMPHGNFRCANIGLFCVSMDFIKRVAEAKTPFPLHKAFKATTMFDQQEKNAWKFERFIFDVLPLSQKTKVVVYPREICFAPLKNKEGKDSPTTVRAALEKREREILKTVFHKEYANSPLEIDQTLYYPTSDREGQLINEGGYISTVV